MRLLCYNSVHISWGGYMYWWPTGNGCLLPEHYGTDSLKVTHLMHTRGCLCRNAWVAMQVKIGCGHLFTLPIQQLKLHNIWFLNMEHPTHKIMVVSWCCTSCTKYELKYYWNFEKLRKFNYLAIKSKKRSRIEPLTSSLSSRVLNNWAITTMLVWSGFKPVVFFFHFSPLKCLLY